MQKGASCPKCQHNFNVKFRDQRAASRQPLLLKCAHTFCESCLLKLVKEEKKCITCPTCKSVTELPHGESSVRKLPSHFYLTGYLMCSQNTLLQQELNRKAPGGFTPMKKKDSTAEKTNRLCSECRLNKATCKCLKCDCLMCGLCYDKVHSLSNSLKQHQATLITDDDNSPFDDVSPLCKLHGKPIEYFCDDDDISICSRCVIMGDHKDHSITSMEEKNRVLLGDMEPALQFATHVVKKLAKADKTLSESVPSVKSETSGVIETIKTHFQGLHAALQTRESELIEQVYTVYQDGVSPIVNTRSELVEEKRNLEQAVRAAHRIMNNNNEVILSAKDILDSLNRAKDVMCIVSSTDPELEDGIRFDGGNSLLESFKTYGSVEGEVPKRVMFHTLNSAPEDLLSDTTDSASVVSCGSITSGTDVTSTADTGDDVIIEDERDILVDDDGAPRSKYVLKPVPGRTKMQGHCENVIVTHIRNPRQFYVQRSALNSRLVKMSKAINTWCKGLATERDIPTEVQKDDFVLCQYSGDKEWYRGRVLSIMTTRETSQKDSIVRKHIEVLYFDYGNHEMVTMDKLKNMEARFMKHPEFLMECALYDIEPPDKDGVWTLEGASTMQQMIANRPMLMTVIREVGNVLEVDLHKPSTDDILDDRPVSLRDSLVFLELANFVTSPEKAHRPAAPQAQRRRDYMKPEARLKGETFEAVVSYCGVPSGFCIQPIGDDRQYLDVTNTNMQQNYQDGADLYKIFCPQVDMICVVQSLADGLWYRGRVLDLPGGKQVDVQYVDYGSIERVSYERIRKILDMYLKLPPLALQCELSDLEPAEPDGSWGAECLEWWTDLTASLHFQVKILEVQVDAVEVILYRILEDSPDNLSVNYQLVANGYAKSTGPGSSVLGPYKKPPDEPTKPMTYRASRKDKQQKSSDIAEAYMTTSPVRDVDEKTISSTSSRSSTPLQTPSVSKPTTPAVTPSKNPSRNLNVNQNNLQVNVAAAQNAAATAATSPTKEVESPSEQIEVIVSAFVSPANFHVQLAKTEGMQVMMSNLQQQFQKSKQTQKAWKVKDFCAARHPVNHLWYRARVVEKLEDHKMKVYFVDYGYVEILMRTELRELDIKMRALSCCSIRCHLADIMATGSADPLVWSATSCEFMASEIKDKTLYIKKEGDIEDDSRGVPIDLLIEESVAETALEPCRTTVYSLIAKMKENGLAIPCRKKRGSGGSVKSVSVEIPFEDQPYMECEQLHYIPHPVPETTSLTVIPTYVDYSAVIYCQLLEDEPEMSTLTDELQASYMESRPQKVKWQPGQACVSYFKTDDLWYRAKVESTTATHANVQYLDFGNSETLLLNQLRIPEQKYIAKPPICLQCVLHNLVPISENGKWTVIVLDYVHSIIVNHQCHIEILKAEEGRPLEIAMILPDGSDLGKTLIQMGAATKPDDLTTEYEVSRKITQVIEKRYPFKRPCLAPVDEYFPVVITHLELPNLIWFQHVPQEPCHIDAEVVQRVNRVNTELGGLVRLSNELAQTETMGKTFMKVPAEGQMCSAKFSYDDCWYRGLVIDRDEESQSALILFVDYGNAEYVYLDRLRVLTASARGLPAQGVRCELYGVLPPGGEKEIWSKHSMTLMLNLLREKQLIACIKTVDPLSIELYQRKGLDEESEQSEELELAYQPLLDEGLAQLDSRLVEESELADLAVTASLKEAQLEEEDVIVEPDPGVEELMEAPRVDGTDHYSTENLE